MWQLVFWSSLALILYIYIGYPALLAVLARLSRRRRSDAPVGAENPSICLVISAFNEENVIRRKLENSLALRYDGRVAVVVASDGSTDRTISIVEDYRDLGVELFHSPRRRGKNAVLNDVVPVRSEDVVVFTDANSLFAPDALALLAARLRDPSVGCVVGELAYARDLTSVGRGENLYWRYEAWIKELESRLGSVLVANGSIFALRRHLFRELYADVANDFQAPFDAANQGAAVVYERRALAMERSAERWEEEFGRKVRIVLRGITGFARLRGRIRGMRLWQFVSHKLLRWCAGVFLTVLLAATIALAPRSPGFAAFLGVQAACYAAAFAGWRMRGRTRVPRVIYIPFYFVMVNHAALVAFIRFATGGRQVVWEKAESTRFDRRAESGAAAGDAVGAMTATGGEGNPRRRLVEK
jgi:cellulose synthase/poly-beta-1,6-N-acetylglucosamine synthase-like glycosyltransferase